jgi:hypothetical protein
MPSKHIIFAAAACALPLSLAACGGSSSGDNSPIVPEGAHYGYVVSKASVPTTTKEVLDFGLDLGSPTSSKPDGKPDNAIGTVLQTLGVLGFDAQGTIKTAVDRGDIILLVDLQTKDLMNSSAAGFGIKIGAMPNPPACMDMNDTTCGRHLDGKGMFQIAAGSPTDDVVPGKIAGGAFTGGPGDLALQIAIGSTTPINLNLLHARVNATIDATNNTVTAILGGLVTQTDLTTNIGPALQKTVADILTASCTGSGTLCGCTGTAAILIGFDTDGDCKLSVNEILMAGPVKQQLQPDSCSMDSCTAPDSLSIGVKVETVKATFPGVM